MDVKRVMDGEDDFGEPIEVRISLTRKDAVKLASLLPKAKPTDTLKSASFGAKLRGALEMLGFRGGGR